MRLAANQEPPIGVATQIFVECRSIKCQRWLPLDACRSTICREVNLETLGLESVELKQPSSSTFAPTSRMWGLALAMCLVLLTNLSLMTLAHLIRNCGLPLLSEYWTIAGFGSVSAQLCLVALVGGLVGSSWVRGFAFANVLAWFSMATMYLSEILERYLFAYSLVSIGELALASLCLPAVVLVVCLPLLAARHYCGWRLTRQVQTSVAHPSTGIEELFISTAVAAACLMLLLSAKELWEIQNPNFFMPIVIVCSAMGLASLLIIVPTIAISFRIERPLVRRVALSAMALFYTGAVTGILIFVNYLTSPPGNVRWFEVVSFSMVWMAAATIVFLSGLKLLKRAGFKLCLPKQNQANLPAEGEAETSCRTQHRWSAAALFSVALVINLSIFGVLKARESQFRRLQTEHAALAAKGGSVDAVSEGEIVALSLGSQADPDDFQRVLQNKKIERLSLAGCPIGNSELQMLGSLRELAALDLSGTAISDEGLSALEDLPSLRGLSIAETQVTVAGIERLLEKLSLTALDLSGLGLQDQDLKDLARSSTSHVSFLRDVSLARNPVSADGISRFLSAQQNVTKLNLSDCAVNPSQLNRLAGRGIRWLVLDGIAIDDQAIAKMGPLLRQCQLSINRSKVTDACLPSLAKIGITGLFLSDTAITEQGLLNSGLNGMDVLQLTSPQFDGSCFQDWPINRIGELSLSGSHVSNQALQKIATLPGLTRLDLSNTDIDDSALQALAINQLYEIDLRGTQVTAEGLSGSRLNHPVVWVSIDQFSFAELRRIRKTIRVRLGLMDWN